MTIHLILPQRSIPFLFYCLVMMSLASCGSPTSDVSEEISRQFQASGRTFVNLAEVLPTNWDKVCILGPYSDTNATKETIGFNWDVTTQSSIESNDRIALLLFIQDHKVFKAVEHARRHGDFTNLSRQCFLRTHATFYHQTNPKKGWPGLFPEK